jgi:hypothetical protein
MRRRIQETKIDGPPLDGLAATGMSYFVTDVVFTLDAMPDGSWYVMALTDTPLELPAATAVLDPETLECVCGFENYATFPVTITGLAVDVEE